MATITTYVDTASTAGGNGTTTALTGIDRAYASLSEWETEEQTDLVSDGNSHQVICAASTGVADTSVTLIAGWTTGASNTITIRMPTGISHGGVYPTGNIYRIEPASGSTPLDIREDYVTVDGIAMTVTSAVDSTRGILVNFVGAASNIVVIDCIFKGVLSASATACCGIYVNDTDAIVNFANNIAYDFEQSGETNYGFRLNTATAGIYNNLAYNCNRGFSQTAGTTTATNNVSGNNTDDFNGTFATLTYNAMDDADAGTGNINGLTWTDIFTDPANGDFTLKDAETDLLQAGTNDPSGSNYGYPAIGGNIRPSTGWDIGPHNHIPDEVTSPYGLADPPYITVTKPTPNDTYYVQQGGSGDGTFLDPWGTLEDADGTVVAGDLIYVMAGTYGPMVWNSSDGTDGNEIVIEAYGDGDAIFVATGTSRNYIIADWIIFDGGADRELIFDGSALDSVQYSLSMTSGSSNCIVSRCVARNANLTAGGGSAMNIEIDSSGAGHKIYNCLIHNSTSVGAYAINGTDIEIRNNVIRDNWGAGVQCNPHTGPDEVAGLIVSGNLIFGNGFIRGAGIRPAITYLGNSTSITTKNNIMWNNKDVSSFASDSGTCAMTVYNNTWYNNIDGGVRFNENNSTTYDIQNNIIYNNGAKNWDEDESHFIKEADTESVNNLTTDPTFVSTTIADATYLTINSSSTDAYEQGTTLGSVTVDYFGNTRDAPYDIGAHEASETSGGGGSGKSTFSKTWWWLGEY